MSKHTLNSLSLVAVLALVVFVVAFALLMIVGDYRLLASFFLAFLIALLSAIVLFFGLGAPSAPYAGAKPATASGATAPAAKAPAAAAPADGGAAADAAAEQKAKEEDAAKAAAEAEAAAKKAEEEAAAKKAEEEAAAKKAEEEAAAKKAEEDAAAKKAEEAEAARKAEASAAPAAAPTPAAASGDLGEDYDGDGVKEGVNEGTRPAGIDAPRDGKADDLKQIKGIGPKLEKLCNSLGFWHFDQVAAWTDDEVAWVDANLTGFKGRVSRDEWVKQAEILSAGGETEFSKRVEDGDVYKK